jgi:hypothetical protein
LLTLLLITALKEYQRYEQLVDDLKARGKLHSNESIQVALKIKKAMNNSTGFELGKFEDLKSKLPRSVQIIVWSRKTQLETKAFPDQYMYAAADDLARDSERRSVFAWKAGGKHSQGEWVFSTINDGETFLIKNTHFNEYLYAAADDLVYDSKRRNVFTWRPGSHDDCDWTIEIISDDEVMLRSKMYNQEPLYMANIDRDDERRHVFTWTPYQSSQCDDSCIWKLKIVE